jgi:hypothetical protein
MAKRKIAKVSSKRSVKSKTPSLSSSDSKRTMELKELMMEMVSHPAVKYVASGLATAILSRLATGLSERYPEIANFIKDNIDNLESGFHGFDSGQHESSPRNRQ